MRKHTNYVNKILFGIMLSRVRSVTASIKIAHTDLIRK
jgi:hypothetical protein